VIPAPPQLANCTGDLRGRAEDLPLSAVVSCAPRVPNVRSSRLALIITDVKVVRTAPQGRQQLIVVKVETSDPGLYGWGCARFTQRASAVVTAIEEFCRPFVVGMDPQKIEDI